MLYMLTQQFYPQAVSLFKTKLVYFFIHFSLVSSFLQEMFIEFIFSVRCYVWLWLKLYQRIGSIIYETQQKPYSELYILYIIKNKLVIFSQYPRKRYVLQPLFISDEAGPFFQNQNLLDPESEPDVNDSNFPYGVRMD